MQNTAESVSDRHGFLAELMRVVVVVAAVVVQQWCVQECRNWWWVC